MRKVCNYILHSLQTSANGGIKEIAEIFEMDFTKMLSFDKNLIFNICNNHNGYGGLIHNHQNNNESNFQELMAKIISDNQDFKETLMELLKSKE